MSVRLNKVGHIVDALPLSTTSSYDFGAGTGPAYFQRDSKVFPFFGGSLINKPFRAYSSNLVGTSGATVSYSGGGTRAFRDGKGDYFLAAFDLAPLIDPDRSDLDTYVAISSSCQVVMPATQGIPQVIPMIVWTRDTSSTSTGVRHVHGFTHLPMDVVNRFSTGVLNCYHSVESDVVVPTSDFANVYFGWFIGRPYPNNNAGVYGFNDVGISVSAASLRGNRPVFDPVMV